MTTDRLTRADALRNRERILATARAQISSQGPDVSMHEIARGAGVAVGTLYRHYPTKTDLVAEIITEHIEALAGAIEDAVALVESGRAAAHQELRRFVSRILDQAANNPALKSAALVLLADGAFAHSAGRILTALDRLVKAGQASGSLRHDLRGTDVALLTCTGPFDHCAAERERWLDLVWPGLLAAPADDTEKGRAF